MQHLPRCLAILLLSGSLATCDTGGRETSGSDEPRPRATTRSYEPARVLGHVEDEEVVEASGIVASRREPETYWVHNDSGGAPRLYCVRSTGASCGTVEVEGAEMVDWEDAAAGPHGDLLVGDIGDNTRSRSKITLYRIPEPEAPGAGASGRTQPSDAIDFSFPRRSHDAETLLVHPRTGTIYIVTKGSPALVFRGSADGGELVVVGALRLPGLLSLPSAGDIAPDGRHVIIATYDRAFELTLPPGRPFRSIWRRPPRPIGLPLVRQREAIAYRRDGRAIVTTSEGRHPALVERALSSD